MKLITGGGGIDKDGNWYELPTEEASVPDSYFDDVLALIAKMPKNGDDVMPLSPEMFDLLMKEWERQP